MKENEIDVEQGFYERCAELLGVPYTYRSYPYKGHTSRWNNRDPGNGRFPGRGLIRLYGDTVHMMLRHPICITRRFASSAEAL